MPELRRFAPLLALLLAAAIAGCGGRAYLHEPLDLAAVEARAETQQDGPISVSAAVLGRDEAQAFFGIDLYDQGIQPVWLRIANGGGNIARYAPVSTDADYYAPLEVAYKNRGGYSDDARDAMDKRFRELAIPRYIKAGETRDGFVFTHAASGAKGFNVDVFSRGDHSFMFLLRVPGFTPDYARLDIPSIYAADEIRKVTFDELPDAIRNLPCCSRDARGEERGEPLNMVLVGNNRELLMALLRSGWRETSMKEAAHTQPEYLYGREQDAIFQYQSFKGDSIYELRLWLAPIASGDDNVWAGQVRHYFRWFGIARRFDADVDEARHFALQKFLYSQALRAVAWLKGEAVVPATSFWNALINTPYFTDGYRSVVWLSSEPYSVLDVDVINWDEMPRWVE